VAPILLIFLRNQLTTVYAALAQEVTAFKITAGMLSVTVQPHFKVLKLRIYI